MVGDLKPWLGPLGPLGWSVNILGLGLGLPHRNCGPESVSIPEPVELEPPKEDMGSLN
ncbi:hypothetical protein HanXRQr2_Chr04g0179431 [Helianthus annuus]|uniref:Uncharacterized protein n=1 Tax=Helianthus annuus TaxID=4232 RepID=A0A9K3JA76_HELAN|nr:hypothetical protein HanXRQr2_Chr04g0179431 [Helianthus annuus]KAJ0932377.1 hypothetical protein HanPSC8_Chr04g0172971 [Helianthus annuus]